MTSQETFELTDFTKPVYLHVDFKKFWEIKLLNLGDGIFPSFLT